MTENQLLLHATVFVYAKDGTVKCLYTEDARNLEPILIATGWHHTATLNPARWIESLCNDDTDPSDMLDELQFANK